MERNASKTEPGAQPIAAQQCYMPVNPINRGIETLIHRDSPEVDILGMQKAPRGSIVGIAQLRNVITPGRVKTLQPDQHIWVDPQQHQFLFNDITAIDTPIPYKGMLKFFEIDAMTALNILNQIATPLVAA